MALTKLPKNAIGTGAIDASKIEDGTLQAVEISGTISSDKIATGTIANNKLSNSTFTIRGTSRALGDSFSLGVNVDWQSVIVADGSTTTTGSAGKGYFINTTSAAHTFTLPASATRGDTIALKDYAATFATNKLTIARNGHNIQGVANNSLIGTNRASLVLVYVDSTKGWLYAEEHNVADLQGPAFITATGGTITTSGNFKIHSFTGDGCFVVSQIGNSPTVPTGGPTIVDYLVVAGGAGGGGNHGGAGGAGGYRTTFPSPGCNAGSFPVTATTFPITVGGGGAGGISSNGQGTSGSNSIFSTITSAGGGGGGYGGASPGAVGSNGGSGGGGGGGDTSRAGGSGNTPPTSPSQGNNGGSNAPGGFAGHGGGGGGAGAVGGAGSAPASPGGGSSGSGGNGSTNSITGSSTTYAGGGAGGRWGPGTLGTAGTGGGGTGGGPFLTTNASPGSANTGGGGGGGADNSFCGGAGGSGIVVIRYKFQ